ncbi:MAG: nucleotide exchange factor GrpE [Patescibacteria group bacterium]
METSDEEFVSEEEAAGGPALVKRLREKLKKAVEDKQEYLDGWQRARADFANYKKEEASMHADREARAKAGVIEKLLPALDALEMALRHSPGKELEILQKQFDEALTRLGVERYGAPGEPFDPSVHEALRQVETDKPEEDHTIASVERSGYKINDYSIRPAQVTIRSYN